MTQAASPVCWHGRPSPIDPEWNGPDHCAACHASVEAAIAAFYRDLLAGTYDERGYTPAERRALDKKLLAEGRLPL